MIPMDLQNISAKRVDSLAFLVLKSIGAFVWISIIYDIFGVNTYIVPYFNVFVSPSEILLSEGFVNLLLSTIQKIG